MMETSLELADDRCWENMLTVRIASQTCQALVDSGAHISIVSDSLLHTIPKRCIRHIQPKFGAVIGVGGVTHKVTARVIVTVNIGGHAFEQDFHVLEGHHSVILGMDFLTKQQAVLDFANSTITLAGTLTLQLTHHAVRSSLARNAKSVFVAANSEVVFNVRLTRSYENDYLVTESIMSMDVNMPEIKVTCCVVKPEGKSTVIRVTNTSSSPITIPRGTTVAICQRVPQHYVVEVNEVEQAYSPEEVDMNDGQLHSLDLPLKLDNADLNSEQKDQLNKFLGNNRSTFAIKARHAR